MNAHAHALVIGHGRMGQLHAKVLRDLGYTVTTVDPNPHTGPDHPTITQAQQHNPGQFDVAAVATPIPHLAPTARQAALITRTLLIEKPMASNTREAELLAQDLAHTNVCVGYTERFNPQIRALTPSRYKTAHFTRHNTRPSPDPDLDLLVHDIDLAHHLQIDQASYDTRDNQTNITRTIHLQTHHSTTLTIDLTDHTQSPLHAMWHAFLTGQPVPTMHDAIRTLHTVEQTQTTKHKDAA